MSKRRSPEEEADAQAYYDAHMHDWESSSDLAPSPPGETPKEIGSVVTVRFPADEAALLRLVAEKEGRTHSDIVRRAVRSYAEQGAPAERPRPLWLSATAHIVIEVEGGRMPTLRTRNTHLTHLLDSLAARP